MPPRRTCALRGYLAGRGAAADRGRVSLCRSSSDGRGPARGHGARGEAAAVCRRLTALDVVRSSPRPWSFGLSPDEQGRLVGWCAASGRQGPGADPYGSLARRADIDAVVAELALAALSEEQRGHEPPPRPSIGIAGELVKGTTSTVTHQRHDPRAPLTEEELQRIVAAGAGPGAGDARARASAGRAASNASTCDLCMPPSWR